MQLEELLAVRHSVFVLGPAGTGKTQVCWRDSVCVRARGWTCTRLLYCLLVSVCLSVSVLCPCLPACKLTVQVVFLVVNSLFKTYQNLKRKPTMCGREWPYARLPFCLLVCLYVCLPVSLSVSFCLLGCLLGCKLIVQIVIQVIKSLFKTYQNLKRKPMMCDINPKAVTTDELFGYINPATREWKDGKV